MSGNSKLIIIVMAICFVFVTACISCTRPNVRKNTDALPLEQKTSTQTPETNKNEYKNGVFKGPTFSLEITGHEFDKYDNGIYILRIFYRCANNGSTPKKAYDIFGENIKASQNDGEFTERLSLYFSPISPKYTELNRNFDKELNTGKSADSIVEYKLSSTTTPVDILYLDKSYGDEISRETYKITL